MPVFIKKISCEQKIIGGIILAGILTSIIQLLQNRDIQLDEAWLTLNILDRNFFELLTPLDNQQAAPILFLWIEKAISLVVPLSEWTFRLLPELCYIASLFFLYKIVVKQVDNIYALALIMAFYAFNNMIQLYASTQAKQYMTDVFVCLAMFYIVTRNYATDKNRLFGITFWGVVFVFLSNVAPVVLFASGLYMAYEDFFVTKTKRWLPCLAVFSVWLAVFGIYYYFFIFNHPTQKFMLEYWEGWFFPCNSLSAASDFILTKVSHILTFFIPYRVPFVVALIFPAAGLCYLVVKRRAGLLILVCTPIALHVALSALKMYPLAPRLMLYLFPCIIILSALGIYGSARIVLQRFNPKIFRFAMMIAPLFFLVYYFGFCYPRQRKQVVKPSLTVIKNNMQEGESIYLHYFTSPVYHFYEKAGYIKFSRITEGRYTRFGIYSGGEVDETDNLKGRTWLLFSGKNDESDIVNYLDSKGYKPVKKFEFQEGDWEGYGESAAYLYDFDLHYAD